MYQKLSVTEGNVDLNIGTQLQDFFINIIYRECLYLKIMKKQVGEKYLILWNSISAIIAALICTVNTNGQMLVYW